MTVVGILAVAAFPRNDNGRGANCHSEARRSRAVGISWVSDYVKWDSSPRRGLRMTVVGILAVAALPQNDNGGEADCHSEARRCRAVGISCGRNVKITFL